MVRLYPFHNGTILFEKIRGWKDSDEQIEICQNKIKDIIYNEAYIKTVKKR